MRRFDPPAIFAALDAERRRRGLTWAQVAAQTGVAESTLRRTREHGRFEADGVLAMAEWLGRPVEEFTRPGDLPPEAVR
ncbi:MAG TPA: helix-turn-helix transcriptional regulator [Micropruina sp.]|nr:helix-turn-helix transcriptional regulator [Propionibacterium sp.]HMQ37634.1 helix-turn-helix transcriptional regulator [Micropruina sp.]HMR23131.1 helix-turn-helix transcriptional regulator [Micropruina sp.]